MDDNVIEEIYEETESKEEPKVEKNWLDNLCEWGHKHPVAIALIIILAPFGLILLGAMMANNNTPIEAGDETPLCTDGLKPVPTETIETTRYRWVPEDEVE